MLIGTTMFSISNLYQKNSTIVSCVFIYKCGWSRQKFLAGRNLQKSALHRTEHSPLRGAVRILFEEGIFMVFSGGRGSTEFLELQGSVLDAGCGSQSPYVLRFCLLGQHRKELVYPWRLSAKSVPPECHPQWALWTKPACALGADVHQLQNDSPTDEFFWAARISLELGALTE